MLKAHPALSLRVEYQSTITVNYNIITINNSQLIITLNARSSNV